MHFQERKGSSRLASPAPSMSRTRSRLSRRSGRERASECRGPLLLSAHVQREKKSADSRERLLGYTLPLKRALSTLRTHDGPARRTFPDLDLGRRRPGMASRLDAKRRIGRVRPDHGSAPRRPLEPRSVPALAPALSISRLRADRPHRIGREGVGRPSSNDFARRLSSSFACGADFPLLRRSFEPHT